MGPALGPPSTPTSTTGGFASACGPVHCFLNHWNVGRRWFFNFGVLLGACCAWAHRRTGWCDSMALIGRAPETGALMWGGPVLACTEAQTGTVRPAGGGPAPHAPPKSMARRSSASFFRDAQRGTAVSHWPQSRWKPTLKREDCGLAEGTEEQATSAGAEGHEVIDARDLLVHLKQNCPAKQSRDSEAVSRDDKKGNVKGKVMTTAQKWELHEVALQQWRKDTESHKLRYQDVQQKYVAYLREKKVEREGRARGTSG